MVQNHWAYLWFSEQNRVESNECISTPVFLQTSRLLVNDPDHYATVEHAWLSALPFTYPILLHAPAKRLADSILGSSHRSLKPCVWFHSISKIFDIMLSTGSIVGSCMPRTNVCKSLCAFYTPKIYHQINHPIPVILHIPLKLQMKNIPAKHEPGLVDLA